MSTTPPVLSPTAAALPTTVPASLFTPSHLEPHGPAGVVVDSGGLSGVVTAMGSNAGTNSVFSRLLPPRQAHHIPVEFTGSGGEYFRIWIVNLLLTFVTLGIYYPWAKVRKLRYFYGNTVVAGHALDFHGEPRKVLRGSLLAGALFFVYSQALEYSAIAGLIGAVLVSALWPVLLRASLQFRLAHTSWRGMRFAFTGSSADAYKALAVPLLLWLLPFGLLAYFAEGGEQAQPDGGGFVLSMGLSYLVLMLSLPYFYWRLKKYQHDHYRLGQLQTELRLTPGAVYGVYVRTFLLAVFAPLLVVGLIALLFGASQSGKGFAAGITVFLLTYGALIFVFGGLFFYIVVMPYFQVRLQNLVWTKTGNRFMRFRSELALRRFIGLQALNYLLVLVTLGFYWPWAAVATRRMRLEAVTLVSRIEIDDLVMALRPRKGDAAAEMGDELLGFDLGL